jgi:hypothetical protein
MAYLYSSGALIPENSSETPLGANGVFKGTAREIFMFPAISVSCFADAPGTLSIEFSNNGTSWYAYATISVKANEQTNNRFTVNSRFFRVNYDNGTVPQTAFRLQSIAGEMQSNTQPRHNALKRNTDSILCRNTDFNLDVSLGLHQGYNVTIKDGFTPAFATGAVPIDITGVAGAYTGFTSGTGAAAEVVVAGADEGVVVYSYLESPDSPDYVFASINVTGAGTYALPHNIWRCNFAFFEEKTNTNFNVGAISIRQTATPANVFCVIPAGLSQSACAAYTVPKGSQVFIDRITGGLRGATSGSMDCYFYFKPYLKSPRLRFSFELQFGTLYFDDSDYTIRIPELVDIVPRVTFSSTNNLVARVSYRIVKYSNG